MTERQACWARARDIYSEASRRNTMPKYQLSRRELIEKCTALGLVVTATSLPISAIAKIWDDSELWRPTPPNDLGPFYKKRSPQARELGAAGDTGLPLTVKGRVLDTRGGAGRGSGGCES